jgi:DNA polymerase-4
LALEPFKRYQNACKVLQQMIGKNDWYLKKQTVLTIGGALYGRIDFDGTHLYRQDTSNLKSILVGMVEKLLFSCVLRNGTSTVVIKIRYSNFDTETKQWIPYTSADHTDKKCHWIVW